MSTCLVPCPACARHVRTPETRCPFCTTPLDPATHGCTPAARGATTAALSRAALLFAGAAAVGACKQQDSVVLYGPPPVWHHDVDDAGASLTVDSGEGSMVALYGPAPTPTEVAPPSAVPSAPPPPAPASAADAGKGGRPPVPSAAPRPPSSK